MSNNNAATRETEVWARQSLIRVFTICKTNEQIHVCRSYASTYGDFKQDVLCNGLELTTKSVYGGRESWKWSVTKEETTKMLKNFRKSAKQAEFECLGSYKGI